MVKIEERSVYEHIANFLRERFNAKVLTEGGVGSGYVDVIFSFDSLPFVMEVKLGRKEKKLAEAVAQGYKYAQSINTRNIIALILTQLSPGQEILIEKLDKLQSIILSGKVEGYVHTEYLEKWVENVTLQQVLEEIYERTSKKEREVDFNSVVKAIREMVEDLYDIIRQARTDEIFEEVAKKLELFVGIGEIKDKEKAKSQVNMLASYLLFNQILFYHIYKIKTNNPELKPLSPITSLKDLQKYFDDLKRIDYRPIYSIELVNKIPEKLEIIEKINMVIKNVLVIRAEHITKDLAGRFFHALLPKEVAKVWAAFYTHPVAAEILANLAIDRWDEKVIDPACGSGTLLAASYQRKLDLYKEEVGRELTKEEIRKLHKKFLEEDITGIDIMPFAAHLTAINLSAQHLEATTNFLRIACMDSLELAPQLKSKDFVEKGILIKSFSKELQKTLTGLRKLVSREGALSLAEEKTEFRLTPVDVVIMNPPFSDRRRLPLFVLNKLKENDTLRKLCGDKINFWGYFIALSDLLLKNNGKVACVIPIAIARGKTTQKIRDYILRKYLIRFIVKSGKNLAFSESAAFRDILFIAEKEKPISNNVKFIIIKKDFKQLTKEETHHILKMIKEINKRTYSDELVEIYLVPQKELQQTSHNFMKFLWALSYQNLNTINKFLHELKNREKDLLIPLDNLKIKLLRGFETTPKGLVDVTFVTNPITKTRTERAKLIQDSIKDEKIIIKPPESGKTYELPIENTLPALRTAVDFKSFYIREYDRLIINGYNIAKELTGFIRWKGNIDWNKIKNAAEKRLTHFAVLYKFNLYSPHIHILSFYSEEKIVPANIFMTFLISKKDAKIFAIFFNSVIYLAQLLINKTETTGQYIAITGEDLRKIDTINIHKLSEEQKDNLIKLFDKLKDVEFPSIMEQFEKRFWARVESDKTILKVLGFSDEEIDYWLPKVYDAIVEELKAMKEVR
jgi:predicted RNA methylase